MGDGRSASWETVFVAFLVSVARPSCSPVCRAFEIHLAGVKGITIIDALGNRK
jgi:hypothetical protein